MDIETRQKIDMCEQTVVALAARLGKLEAALGPLMVNGNCYHERLCALEARQGKDGCDDRGARDCAPPASPVAGSSPASPAAPPAFKVGDRVRHIADGWTGIVRQGAMQRVKYSDHIQVEWDDGAGPATGLFPPSDFTLLTPAPAAAEEKYPSTYAGWCAALTDARKERDAALRDLEACRRERDEARARLAWFREWLEKAKEAPHAD